MIRIDYYVEGAGKTLKEASKLDAGRKIEIMLKGRLRSRVIRICCTGSKSASATVVEYFTFARVYLRDAASCVICYPNLPFHKRDSCRTISDGNRSENAETAAIYSCTSITDKDLRSNRIAAAIEDLRKLIERELEAFAILLGN